MVLEPKLGQELWRVSEYGDVSRCSVHSVERIETSEGVEMRYGMEGIWFGIDYPELDSLFETQAEAVICSDKLRLGYLDTRIADYTKWAADASESRAAILARQAAKTE